jgi:hypothetical protein
MDINHKKYIKYKSKYLDLKEKNELKGGYIALGKFIVFFKPQIVNDKTKLKDTDDKKKADDLKYTEKYKKFRENLKEGNHVLYDDIDYFSAMTFYLENNTKLIRPHLNIAMKKIATTDFFWNRVKDIATDGSKTSYLFTQKFINKCKNLITKKMDVLKIIENDIKLATPINLDNLDNLSNIDSIKNEAFINNPYLNKCNYLILEKSMSITGFKYKILKVGEPQISATPEITYINLQSLKTDVSDQTGGDPSIIFGMILGGIFGFMLIVWFLAGLYDALH